MKRIFYLYLYILPFLLANNINAQQDPQFSHFPFGLNQFNPAVSGMQKGISAGAILRTQWVGIDGHPVSQLVFADMPLYQIKSGAGISITNDQAGQEKTLFLSGSYSYIMQVGTGELGIGISAGIIQKSIDGSLLKAPQGTYEPGVISHNDEFIPLTKVSGLAPDLGLGAYYVNGNLSVGLGSTHLISPKIKFDLGNQTSIIQYKPHLYFQGSYLISVSDLFVLKPSILAKSDLTENQVDLNTLLVYNGNIWAGVSFRGYSSRSKDAIIGMLGIKLSNNFSFGYSYDVNLSALRVVNGGSHELMVNYFVPMIKPRKGKIINNPRFLSF